MKKVYTYSDEELQELLNDDTSRVFVKKSVKQISLSGFHFTNLKQSLSEILDQSINHFKPELEGIVLSYRNIKVLNKIGTIINDDSTIYLDVQADYYLFSPDIGCVLTGVVNKKSSDHVGCLVHKLFNVSIPHCEEDPWEGANLEIGQKISFRVEFVDFELNLPYIRGRLVDSSSQSEVTEEALKKKKKKKNKDKSKEKNEPLANQDTEVKDYDKEEFAEQKNIKKIKRKDKKEKKHAEYLNQIEPLLKVIVQDSSESENLHEPLANKDVDKSALAKSETASFEWDLSRDFSDISVLASSTQQDEILPKKKQKKKKSKDVDANFEYSNHAVDRIEISQELKSSKHEEKLINANDNDVVIQKTENAPEEPVKKKKHKKHKKHKLHDADTNIESCEIPIENLKLPSLTESGKNPLQNDETTSKIPKDSLLSTPKNETANASKGSSTEEGHIESPTSKKNKQDSSTSLQSPIANASNNWSTIVNCSVMNSSNRSPMKEASKRKSSDTELSSTPTPKKRKSIRFSTEVKMIPPENKVQSDSEESHIEPNTEKLSKRKEAELDTDELSHISGASAPSPFSGSLYSGANMVNSVDRKRKKVVKGNDDAASLKRPINSISPSLISSARTLLQNYNNQQIQDPTNAGMSSPTSSQEIKEQDVQSICPQGKSDSEQSSSSQSKLLTQKESSSHGRIATDEKLNTSNSANVSAGFNSTINAFESLDISQLIAKLNSTENTTEQKQEQCSKSPKSPRADKGKKNKTKKTEDTVSKDIQPTVSKDSQPAKTKKKEDIVSKDSQPNVSKDSLSKDSQPTVSKDSQPAKTKTKEDIVSKDSQPTVSKDSQPAKTKKKEDIVSKDSQSAKTKKKEDIVPKHSQPAKTKKKEDIVPKDSQPATHNISTDESKEPSKTSSDKVHKKKKKDKDKKKKEKKQKKPKTSKEKKTKKENDLTDLSRKLLQDFLKKQNSN